MPDRNSHLQKATDNETLARSLNWDDTTEADWAVTMLFYSALHYIDAFLAGKNTHPRDHQARDSAIENNGTISVLYNDYRRLKDGSRSARYDFPAFQRNDLSRFDQRFARVKSFILERV